MYPLKTQETTNCRTTYRFQEEDAVDGTSFAPFGPCRSTRQFPSSETQHGKINTGTGSTPTRPKGGRPYHKTIAIVFASRLLQIGDNQGPNADDVGDNVHKMRHTQIVGEDGLLQSRSRGYPIKRLSSLQPIHDEVDHCEPDQAAEHTGSCPL